MQKIRPLPYAHVGGKPHYHPHQPDPSQNWKGGRASGHASSPLDVSNVAQPTTGGCSCTQRVMSRHSKRVSAGTRSLRQEDRTTGARSEARGKKTATIEVKKQQLGK